MIWRVYISGCGVVAVRPISGKSQCENLQANHSVPLPLAFLFTMAEPESNKQAALKASPEGGNKRRRNTGSDCSTGGCQRGAFYLFFYSLKAFGRQRVFAMVPAAFLARVHMDIAAH